MIFHLQGALLNYVFSQYLRYRGFKIPLALTLSFSYDTTSFLKGNK